MKIIGKAGPRTYIVEMGGFELIKLTGAESGHVDHFTVGTKFEVDEAFKFLRDLRVREDDVRRGVEAMTALGGMLGHALPSFIVSPPAPKEAPADGDLT